MYLIGDYEKSLVLWHKAKKMRQKQPEVKEAIENICQTIVSSMTNCFAGNDTADIIQVNKLGDIFLWIDSLAGDYVSARDGGPLPEHHQGR